MRPLHHAYRFPLAMGQRMEFRKVQAVRKVSNTLESVAVYRKGEDENVNANYFADRDIDLQREAWKP